MLKKRKDNILFHLAELSFHCMAVEIEVEALTAPYMAPFARLVGLLHLPVPPLGKLV